MKPEQTQLRVSVVIPVFNGGSDLEKCLAAIKASSYPVFECILVDDASTDGMAGPTAKRQGVRVISLSQQCGPANARNHGAAEASGEILFFTDADVLLHPDAISLAVKALQSDPEIGAVFGSYDDQPRNTSFISQYRNLFHHWVHQTGADEASTFWTGCGAIRRNIFSELGGFSQDYARPSIEDIELGGRLRRCGYKIRLVKNMFGQHMKQWKFFSMIKTDIFDRGVPWMLLVLRNQKMANDLNLSYKSRVATILAGLLGLSLAVLVLTGHIAAILPLVIILLISAIGVRFSGTSSNNRKNTLFAAALTIFATLASYWLVSDPLALIPLSLVLAIIATHLAFYRYVAQKRGAVFTIVVVPMQVIFFLCCVVSVPLAYIEHYFGIREATAGITQSDESE
jgi:glycosyltransferase involved in cell wall biosynthesis